MLAPIDKIRRPGGNDIMQIVVTTACDRNCSNCTQLLPFRTDYKFMSVTCFRAAVQSLEGWPGVVALFGGNPCVHPKFAELCKIITEFIPPDRRGLWTNNVFKHGELAAKVFGQGRLNLNAHGDPEAFAEMSRWFPGKVIPESKDRASWHSAILADYRDLGISEAAWIQARERCDINQKWSAAIVERNGAPYGYFCEVAASIDGIRGVNNGIPALEGWWKRRMDSFGDQVRNCCDRGCGVPLRLKGHLDSEEIYDITDTWIGPTHGLATLVVHRQEPEHCQASTDYMRRVTN